MDIKQSFKKVILITLLVLLLLSIFLVKTGFTIDKKTLPSESNLESIQILTGSVDVEGTGVSIALSDNEVNDNKINKIIHDQDLIKVVNLLASAGAEVISINDERLLPISEIKANTTMIKINNHEYNSPFNIKAIGDSEKLLQALESEGSYINLLKKDVKVEIEKKDNLFIPKYKDNIIFKYAKPSSKNNN